MLMMLMSEMILLKMINNSTLSIFRIRPLKTTQSEKKLVKHEILVWISWKEHAQKLKDDV